MMHEEFDKALRFEVDRILSDPAFSRAPIQSKLLKFLGEKSCANGHSRLTQFDIATQALGRPEDFDETTDSYVRTQISRLRSTLTNYYSRNEPASKGCVFIKPGDYHLRLASRQVAYPRATREDLEPSFESEIEGIGLNEAPKAPMGRPSKLFDLRRPRATFAIGALFSIAIMLVLAPSFMERDEGEVAGRHRPFVSYQVESVGRASTDGDLANLEAVVQATVEEALAKSLVVHPSFVSDSVVPDYNIRILLNLSATETTTADFFLADEKGRTIYHGSRDLPDNLRAGSSIIRDELVVLTAPPGIISRHQVSLLRDRPRSGFECFLMVEVGRAGGASTPEFLRSCLADYPETEYAPFLQARQLFAEFQQEAIQSNKFEQATPHWTELGSLLEEHPSNPYLNTLAAKVLLGNGECELAEPYLDAVLEQGNMYHALELMLATEISACISDDEERAYWEQRSLAIFNANRHPHALLELYEITALLAYDHADHIAGLSQEPFTQPDSGVISQLSRSIKNSVMGRARFNRNTELRATIWNEKVRDKVNRRIRV